MTRIPQVTGFAGREEYDGAKARGKGLRAAVPRSAHAELVPQAGRPGAVAAVEESNAAE